MSMRYIIRRKNPEDLEEIRGLVSDLNEQLGEANASVVARHEIPHLISSTRRVVFGFIAQKKGDGYEWLCPNIELVAETEKDFRDLAQEFGVTDLSFLLAQPV